MRELEWVIIGCTTLIVWVLENVVTVLKRIADAAEKRK